MSHHNHSVSKWIQVEVAFGVLFWRPAAIFIWIPLLVLSGLLIVAAVDGQRTTKLKDNTPSHKPSGTELFLAKEWQKAMAADTPNLTVRRLNMAFLRPRERAGETKLKIAGRQHNSEQRMELAGTSSSVSVSEIVRKFPKTQWVFIQDRHLDSLSIQKLNELPDLNSINFSTNTLQPQHLAQLTQLSKIQNLTIEAIRCDADLSDLAKLKNLKSLHLDASGFDRSFMKNETPAPKLVVPNHVAQLAAIPNLEELVITDHDDFLDYAWVSGLTADNRPLYEQFVQSLKTFPSLKTLYVGRMSKPHGDTLLSVLRDDVPALAVYPAAFDSAMSLFVAATSLLTFTGLLAATIHLMTCNSLEQNCIMNGTRQANLKVQLTIAALLMAISTLVITFNTFADWLPVVAFQLAVFAAITTAIRTSSIQKQGRLQGKHLGRKLIPLLFFPLVAFVAFVWIEGLLGTVYSAMLFCGRLPLLCILVLGSSVVLVAHNLKAFKNLHRQWAESGMPPAASWRDLQQSLSVYSDQLAHAGVQEKQLKLGQLVVDAWEHRLENLVSTLSLNPTSLVLRCRLWLSALLPVGILRPIITFALIWPMIILWPMAWHYLTESQFDDEAMGGFPMSLAIGFIMAGLVVVTGWYGRQPMYATEVLWPTTRSTWRTTVVYSMLAAVGLMSALVWGQIQFARWLGQQDLVSYSNGLSLLSLLAAMILATGMFLSGLSFRRVTLAAPTILIGFLAYAPLGLITLVQVGESAASGLPSLATLFVIVGVELILGVIVLKIAWHRWAQVELARL